MSVLLVAHDSLRQTLDFDSLCLRDLFLMSKNDVRSCLVGLNLLKNGMSCDRCRKVMRVVKRSDRQNGIQILSGQPSNASALQMPEDAFLLYFLCLLVLILLDILFTAEAVLDVSWWSSVAQLSTSNLLAGSTARPACLELKGLSPGQARICELFKDHMPAVGHGAKQAIDEIMPKEYGTVKESGQSDFENTCFDNSGFGDSRNQGQARFSQDYKRKEDSPKKQGGFENSSFENAAFGGSDGRDNFQDRQQSHAALYRSGGHRPQQSRYGGGDRSRDSKGPQRNQSFGKSGGSASRFSFGPGDNGQRFEHSSSYRNSPSFNDSGYRASRTEHQDQSASKLSSSGQKRNVGLISHYHDGHDNRTCSPERKQTRNVTAKPSIPRVHDK